MNDEQLLQRVAKYLGVDTLYVPRHLRHLDCWNPLENDGDAMVLISLCNLLVDATYKDFVVVRTEGAGWKEYRERFEITPTNSEHRAAVRRAIVRAVADMVEYKEPVGSNNDQVDPLAFLYNPSGRTDPFDGYKPEGWFIHGKPTIVKRKEATGAERYSYQILEVRWPAAFFIGSFYPEDANGEFFIIETGSGSELGSLLNDFCGELSTGEIVLTDEDFCGGDWDNQISYSPEVFGGERNVYVDYRGGYQTRIRLKENEASNFSIDFYFRANRKLAEEIGKAFGVGDFVISNDFKD